MLAKQVKGLKLKSAQEVVEVKSRPMPYGIKKSTVTASKKASDQQDFTYKVEEVKELPKDVVKTSIVPESVPDILPVVELELIP